MLWAQFVGIAKHSAPSSRRRGLVPVFLLPYALLGNNHKNHPHLSREIDDSSPCFFWRTASSFPLPDRTLSGSLSVLPPETQVIHRSRAGPADLSFALFSVLLLAMGTVLSCISFLSFSPSRSDCVEYHPFDLSPSPLLPLLPPPVKAVANILSRPGKSALQDS